jgi:hypothetical protein
MLQPSLSLHHRANGGSLKISVRPMLLGQLPETSRLDFDMSHRLRRPLLLELVSPAYCAVWLAANYPCRTSPRPFSV